MVDFYSPVAKGSAAGFFLWDFAGAGSINDIFSGVECLKALFFILVSQFFCIVNPVIFLSAVAHLILPPSLPTHQTKKICVISEICG
jgi:hypothetical protein